MEAPHPPHGRTGPGRYPGLGPDAFGHCGATGAQSFADPRSGIAHSHARRRFAFGGGGGAPKIWERIMA
ncbi:hypothetical protein ACIG5E_28735 [Kitasatospora sp. NPDC053057]|uniref:hypothetical protein n=1 Tax=Kitasatospora sp. NPDC053057 TaxID=3364062 RepID=UPI0037CC86B5